MTQPTTTSRQYKNVPPTSSDAVTRARTMDPDGRRALTELLRRLDDRLNDMRVARGDKPISVDHER